MTFVVDASVAVKWFVQEVHTERALALLDHALDLLAPDLIVLEVGHALWKKRRRGEVDVIDVTESLTWLRRGIPELLPVGDLLDDALALTVEIDHPIYDCLYVALAEIADARLVTDDERLRRRVAGTRLERRVLRLADVGAP